MGPGFRVFPDAVTVLQPRLGKPAAFDATRSVELTAEIFT